MILRFLAILGRHGTLLMAAGIVAGLAVPPLAHVLAPTLPPLIFLLTTATMLRIDWPQVMAHARRPLRIAMVVAWTLLLTPMLMAFVVKALHLPEGLAEAMVLWSASAPLISLPAIAFLMGLDGALALLVMVTATLLMPITLPPLVLGLIGVKLGIGILPLMARLGFFVAGAVTVAAVVRRVAGPERLKRRAMEINGINVLLLVLFALGVMDGMWQRLAQDPDSVLLYAASAMGASLALQVVSCAAFAWLDRFSSLTIGLIGGNRNMAIVWASLAGGASPDLMLFFACLQLPIYLLPAALAPIYRRLGAQAA